MIRPPANATEAVDLLLARCPKLEPAWRSLCELMDERTGDSVGIYNVFGQVVLPLLLYALDGHKKASNEVEEHRSQFNVQREWAAIPRRGSTELADLLKRVYEALDLWSASDSSSIRDAVYIEMVEDGYVDLTVEDLLDQAGPALRELSHRRQRRGSP